MAGRLRSILPLIGKTLSANFSATQRSTAQKASLFSAITNPEFTRNYATAPSEKELQKVEVPLMLFGKSGEYATSLYKVAVRGKVLEKVEADLNDFVAAIKNSPQLSMFIKDPILLPNKKVKTIIDIANDAKFHDYTRNILALMAEHGHLKMLDETVRKFGELSMAHRGEVKAIVTTVIPLPAEEEKELKETLEFILSEEGKKKKTVKLEQKIDPSILGGIMVEFDMKMFDMSIKTRARQMERFLRDPANIQ